MTMTTDGLSAAIVASAEGGGFTLEAMIEAASGPVFAVLIILAIMLLWCFYVAVERLLFLTKANRESVELNAEMAPYFANGDGAGALRCASKKQIRISYVKLDKSQEDTAKKIQATWADNGSLPKAYLTELNASLSSPLSQTKIEEDFMPLALLEKDASGDKAAGSAASQGGGLPQAVQSLVSSLPGLLDELYAAEDAGVLPTLYSNDKGVFVVGIDKSQMTFGNSYLAHVLVPALGEYVQSNDRHGIDAAERAIDTVLVTEGESLRRGFNILATTGATAPFVGLVGTIFGIINAFQMMEKEGATITDLAPAIGEALITTAIGIIVAIVGVWLFNFFTARIEAITNKMSVTAQVLLDWCEKQTIARSNSDKA